MRYIQFYQRDAAGNISEACGDRSVIIVDGRLRPSSHLRIGAKECVRRGYIGYRLFSGESFTRSRPNSELFLLELMKP